MKRLALAITLTLLGAVFVYLMQPPKYKIEDSAVKVVNTQENSGGSGVVVGHTVATTLVMTNKHVCEVIENGGVVIFNDVARKILSYLPDTEHDLCLVKVNGLFGTSALISTKDLEFNDHVRVVGHPALLPKVITDGMASGPYLVHILASIRKCTPEDFKKFPNECMFLGGIPEIRNFNSILTSALVMPGSSGSGVFNDKNQLVGLVFAGQGGLSFSLIVPLKFVQSFYDRSVKRTFRILPVNPPKAISDIKSVNLPKIHGVFLNGSSN